MRPEVFRGNNSFTKINFSPELHPFNQSFCKSPTKEKGDVIQLNKIPLRNKVKPSVNTSNSDIKIENIINLENSSAKISYKKPLHREDIDRKQAKAVVPAQRIVERLRGNIQRLQAKIQELFSEEIREEKQQERKKSIQNKNSKLSPQKQQSKYFDTKDESLLTESDRRQSRLRIQSLLAKNQIQRKCRKEGSRITGLSNGTDL